MDFEPVRQHKKLVAANPFTEMVLFQFTVSNGQTIMLVAEATQATQIPNICIPSCQFIFTTEL